MKRKTIAGLVAVVAIVMVVIFAGCVEEKSPTPVSTPTPTPTLAPSEESEILSYKPTETDENQPPVISWEKKGVEIKVITLPSDGGSTKFDLSDMATDPDGDELIWSTKVRSSTGDPYEHKLIIEIDENNIATIRPVSKTIDEGEIEFIVSDGELTDSIIIPYKFLPKFIRVEVNKPEQGRVYSTMSIELDVVEIPGETIEYWVNEADFLHNIGIVYTGSTTLTEADGIKEGENFIIFKTKSSPMVSTVSFTIKTVS